LGDGGDAAQGDAPRGLQLSTPLGELHRFPHHAHGEIVEEDELGAGLQGLAQLPQVFHLDLDGGAGGGELAGLLQGPVDAAGGQDVVFLDQDAVVEADALVLAAADLDRVLLGQAQARQGLAGIEDFRLAALYRFHVAPRGGGGGGEGLQEVEGRPFGGEQGPGGAADFAQHLAFADAGAFLGAPGDFHPRVHLPEAFLEPGRAAQDGLLPRHDVGDGHFLGGDQLSGEVAGAGVFLQGGGDVGADGGGEVGEAHGVLGERIRDWHKFSPKFFPGELEIASPSPN
jgi:hypothetical protein